MLVLTRKLNQAIVLGEDVIVRVLRLDKDFVQLGIEAPPALKVDREEIRQLQNKEKHKTA